MIKAITVLFVATIAGSALAQPTKTVTSSPLVHAPTDTKKPLYIDPTGQFVCPEGSDLFVRALPPTHDPKDKTPAPQGDYESFYFAKSANPSQPAIIVSRPGVQEYLPTCLTVK